MTIALAKFQQEANQISLDKFLDQVDNIGEITDETVKSISNAYSAINDNADAWYKAQTEFDAVQKQMDEGGTPT